MLKCLHRGISRSLWGGSSTSVYVFPRGSEMDLLVFPWTKLDVFWIFRLFCNVLHPSSPKTKPAESHGPLDFDRPNPLRHFVGWLYGWPSGRFHPVESWVLQILPNRIPEMKQESIEQTPLTWWGGMVKICEHTAIHYGRTVLDIKVVRIFSN